MYKLLLFSCAFSCVFHRSHQDRLDRVERKLQAMEMSMIQDVYMIREDLKETNTVLNQIAGHLNDTALRQVQRKNGSSIKDDEEIAKLVEQKVAGVVRTEIRRLKRAIVAQKMHTIREQEVQSEKLESQVSKAERTINNLNEKVDNELNNASKTFHDTLEEFREKVDSQLANVQDSVQSVLQLVETKVEAELLKISEAQTSQSKAIAETFDRKFDLLTAVLQLVETKVEAELFKISEAQTNQSKAIAETINRKFDLLTAVLQNTSIDAILREVLQSVRFMEIFTLKTVVIQTLTLKRVTVTLADKRLEKLIRSKEKCNTDTHDKAKLENCMLDFSASTNLIGRSDVRLGNSSIVNQGVQCRLEIFLLNTWGTICDDSFDEKDAKVACKMFGYRNGKFKVKAYFGQGSGPILLDNTGCSGSEDALFDCKGNWEVHNCGHHEDVGVVCWD